MISLFSYEWWKQLWRNLASWRCEVEMFGFVYFARELKAPIYVRLRAKGQEYHRWSFMVIGVFSFT